MRKTPRRLPLLVIVLLLPASLAAEAPPEVVDLLPWISQEELAARGRAVLAELPQGDRLALKGMLRPADERPAEDPAACDVTGKSGAFEGAVDARAKLRAVE